MEKLRAKNYNTAERLFRGSTRSSGDSALAEEVIQALSPKRFDFPNSVVYREALDEEYVRRVKARLLTSAYSEELGRPLGAVA